MDDLNEKERTSAMITRGVTISGFPINLWRTWEMDCIETFGNCRWIKMWNDHLKANIGANYEMALSRIKQLEQKVVFLEAELGKGKPLQTGVATFSGTIGGG